jgi:hypothetical protein
MPVLNQITSALISTTPEVARMRGHPEYRDWAAQLRALGEEEDLAPLRATLAAIAADALTTMKPLQQFLAKEAGTLNINVYRRGAEVADLAIATQPCAALVLSLLAMLGWAAKLGESVNGQVDGMPHPGWLLLPLVTARAAARLGGGLNALRLVDYAYDVLAAAKYRFNPKLRAAMDAYRDLAGMIQRRNTGAIADLAEDLREASRPGPPDFRAEIGAMLWTLGYTPECELFRPGHDAAPLLSRRFYRRVVEQSLAAIPTDPLLQYIWLAMKDRPPFDLRGHGDLFGRINLRYAETILDLAMDERPSEVFAKTLIAWFRGDLDLDAVRRYLSVNGLVEAQFPHCDWLIFLRMQCLAHMLAEQFDLLPTDADTPDTDQPGTEDFWRWIAARSASLRRTNALHPEWPPLGGRVSLGTAKTLETLADTDPAAALDVVEASREASLTWWLAAAPPTPAASERDRIGPALEHEAQLLVWLRGAYFQILTPILPIHYRRYGMDLADMTGKDRADPFDPEAGRTQFKEIFAELTTLYEGVQEQAPEYARRRLHPRAGVAALAHALGAHTRSAEHP